ncbi:MAG: hypothetical protein ACRDYA_12705 [Egibacteraceae bacterium]
MLPTAGAGGPLLQAGLIFTNPADDGGFYERLWDFALRAAREGHLPHLPWDDMCIVAATLGQGGPLWERLLTLGHKWNYIADAAKDPGIFGCAAHYGGHRAKAFFLDQVEHMFPPVLEADGARCWGSVATPGSAPSGLVRGPWPHPAHGGAGTRAGSSVESLSIPLPFCLSWHVPASVATVRVSGAVHGPGTESPRQDAVLFLYVDGRLTQRVPARDGHVRTVVPVLGAETLTIVGVSATPGCALRLDEPFPPAPSSSAATTAMTTLAPVEFRS